VELERGAGFAAAACLLLAAVAPLSSGATNAVDRAGIAGRIHITKKLTKERAPAIAVYHRGAAVAPASERETDFIAGELRRTAIYVESQSPLPAQPVRVEIEQRNRTFSPETVVVPAGSTVSFPNLDPIFHNVFSLSRPQAFDLGNYPRGETREVVFRKPGIVPVYCHLHPNMRATVVVTPNSWAAMPGPDGTFALPALPPGIHTIVVWHRSAGFFRKQLDTRSEPAPRVDFVIPVDPSEDK
jgi:plastocyanin